MILNMFSDLITQQNIILIYIKITRLINIRCNLQDE